MKQAFLLGEFLKDCIVEVTWEQRSIQKTTQFVALSLLYVSLYGIKCRPLPLYS